MCINVFTKISYCTFPASTQNLPYPPALGEIAVYLRRPKPPRYPSSDLNGFNHLISYTAGTSTKYSIILRCGVHIVIMDVSMKLRKTNNLAVLNRGGGAKRSNIGLSTNAVSGPRQAASRECGERPIL